MALETVKLQQSQISINWCRDIAFCLAEISKDYNRRDKSDDYFGLYKE
jgi:hypothetical protein